jgi:phage terminase large subunit-like protein
MVEGESGIMAISSAWFRPNYEPSKKRLTWPNGAQATVFSSEDHEELRGPQHDAAWIDELAKYRYQDEVWSNLMFGMRLGPHPRVCITTTPRPTKTMKMIVADPLTTVTKGTTYENLDNLSPVYRSIIRKYEGTRLGRQELEAVMLDDNPGALWTGAMIEDHRRATCDVPILRMCVGVDPSASEDGAEAGIIVAGRGADGHGYVFADSSIRARPEAWAKRAVNSWRTWNADTIVAEQNNGGLMVEGTIKAVDRTAPVKLVTASRGKITRAEPISALYEQGLIHHVGVFPELEDQMTEYDPLTAKESPDRMDALVWVLTELFTKGTASISDADFGVERLTSMEFPH